MQLTPFPNSRLKEAFDSSTFKALHSAAWIGIFLNLLFSFSDLFILPTLFVPFLLLRLAVSGSTLVLLLFLSKKWWNIYFIILWIVCGISIQNAIMWNLMDLIHFQQHALAYAVLFIGMGMLALWSWNYSLVVLLITILSNYIAYKLWSPLSSSEWFTHGGLLIFTALIFAIFQIRNRFRLILNELEARIALADSNEHIKQQHEILQHKNQEITDSIHYAKYIQDALLPQRFMLDKIFPQSFIYFRPKDIVSGDFYWFYSTQDFDFIVVADCTGHGVPGGFMTMLGLSFLDEIIKNQGVSSPALILNQLRDRIISALNQKDNPSQSKDGMDISLIRFSKKHNLMSYACANQSIYLIQDASLTRLKGNSQPCGYSPHAQPFDEFEVALNPSDSLYLMSDGFADQFGGDKGKKIRSKTVQQLIIDWNSIPLHEQEANFHSFFETWKKHYDQIDDVLVLGIRI